VAGCPLWLIDWHGHGVSSVMQAAPSHRALVVMLVELRQRADRLDAGNAEPRRRAGSNSSSSSRPPSPDGLARRRPQPGKRAGSGRSRSKRPGAPGSTLEMVADPDQVLEHRPDRWVNPKCRSTGRSTELPGIPFWNASTPTRFGRSAGSTYGCGLAGKPGRPGTMTSRENRVASPAGPGSRTFPPPGGQSDKNRTTSDRYARSNEGPGCQSAGHGRSAACDNHAE
jgi:hypothetical protein